jgi:cobalt-zinc-cadmium efflux system outer membrane protein
MEAGLRDLLKTLALGLGCAVVPCARSLAQSVPGVATLTRRQAVDTAVAHNPQLRVAVEQVAQARARVTEATAFPDPTVSADYSGLTGPTRFSTNSGSDLGVGLTVPFPTKFLLRGSMGNADVHAAEFSLVQLRQQIASQTSQEYDSLLMALRHHADLQEGRTLAADFLQKTQVQFDQGAVARLDVIKARVTLAQADNDLIASTRAIANARAGLNRLLGRTLGAPIEAADSLGDIPALPPLDQLLDVAHASRPELRGLASQQQGAAAATALARTYWLPDVGVSVSKNFAQGSDPSFTTGIGFSVPLFFWNHERGEVAESRRHEAELTAAYRDLDAQVELDVRNSYGAAATALLQVAQVRDQVLPAAQEAYRIASVSYGLGGSSALDVLDARRTLLDARGQYVDALGAASSARADLERAVGAPLDHLVTGAPRDR